MHMFQGKETVEMGTALGDAMALHPKPRGRQTTPHVWECGRGAYGSTDSENNPRVQREREITRKIKLTEVGLRRRDFVHHGLLPHQRVSANAGGVQTAPQTREITPASGNGFAALGLRTPRAPPATAAGLGARAECRRPWGTPTLSSKFLKEDQLCRKTAIEWQWQAIPAIQATLPMLIIQHRQRLLPTPSSRAGNPNSLQRILIARPNLKTGINLSPHYNAVFTDRNIGAVECEARQASAKPAAARKTSWSCSAKPQGMRDEAKFIQFAPGGYAPYQIGGMKEEELTRESANDNITIPAKPERLLQQFCLGDAPGQRTNNGRDAS
ncbi:hypothetical protein B0H13DRAFT_1863388 [Mycena leptocephala]|nr:hypothetical protein B0H13DRAFT_1863388 [Mycena leptocephala]